MNRRERAGSPGKSPRTGSKLGEREGGLKSRHLRALWDCIYTGQVMYISSQLHLVRRSVQGFIVRIRHQLAFRCDQDGPGAWCRPV